MKTFQVIPNPYQMLDAVGKPIAVFPCHMKHAPGQYVGATKVLDVFKPAQFVELKSKTGQVRREVAAFDRSKAVFSFVSEPVAVPADGEVGAYYRRGVVSGALLAADKATAAACGVNFVADALEAEKRRAAQEFRRQFGELPAWALDQQQSPAMAQK